MSNPAPGWFPDPTGQPQQRWWNGVQWDDATQPLEPVAVAPIAVAPVAVAPVPQIPAGWYADPTGAPHDRWWDGARWHDATQPSVNTVAVVDNIPTYATVAAQPYAGFAPVEQIAPIQRGYTPMGGYSSSLSSTDSRSVGWASEPVPLDPSTTWVWAVVWSPLFYALAVVVSAIIGDLSLSSSADSSSLPTRGLSIGAYIGMIVIARNDSKLLKERGFTTFGWGWMFIGPLVYLIGRTVVVYRQAGRGVAPLLAWFGTNAVYTIVVVGVVVAFLMPELSAL